MPKSKWKWSDALEMRRPLGGLGELTISLSPRYEGRGVHNTLQWEVVMVDEKDEDKEFGRFSFTIENTTESERKRWLIARKHVDALIENHAIPQTMAGSNVEDEDPIIPDEHWFTDALLRGGR